MREEGADTKSGGTGLVTAGIVIVAVIAAGAYLSLGQNSPPSEEELATVVDPNASVPSDTAPAADVGAETSPDEPEVVAPEPPSIDEVRLEADGLTVIAGRAAPGAEVSVLIDGLEVAKTTADARGDFAAVGVVEPSDAARVLTLKATGEDGPVASNEDVILAPVPSADPVQTAEAPPDAQSPVAGSDDTPAAGAAEATPEEPADASASDGGSTEPQMARPSDDGVQDDVAVAEAAPDAESDPEPTSDPADPSAPDAGAAVASAPAPKPEAPVVTEDVERAEVTDDDLPTDASGDQVAAAERADAPTDDAPADNVAPSGADDQEDAGQADTGTRSVAVLKSTAEGVELLQPGPEVLSSIAIDTIGYSDSGDVQLSGRAVAGTSEVRVYLDNRFVAALPVDSTGTWRGNVPEVDAGIYRLRVDEVNEAGDVTSRLETPFKREAPAVLAEATEGPAGPVRAVTVQTGDTLWAIARDRYGEGLLYVKVFEANRGDIRDPDLIYPGQVFDLPVE